MPPGRMIEIQDHGRGRDRTRERAAPGLIDPGDVMEALPDQGSFEFVVRWHAGSSSFADSTRVFGGNPSATPTPMSERS